MGIAVRDEERVATAQLERCATLHTQQRAAVADEMKLRLTGRLMERHTKWRAGFNSPVFHPRKAHAA